VPLGAKITAVPAEKGANVAIYHMHIQIITRGAGKSAVAAAAYRSGETLTNERDGVTHDYTRKSGIFHSEILLPENAPAEYANRSTLWNSVEKAERYKTAQLAREIEVALPAEFSTWQNVALVRGFVNDTFVKAGMCADFSIHDKGDGNPHCHIMLTMRPLNSDGTWGAKSATIDGKKIPTVNWNERSKAEEWREAWANAVNGQMAFYGNEERVDHRSYERQGLEIIPTVHMGVAAMQMERRGIETELGDRNREIVNRNKQLKQMKARIRKLEDWAKAEREKPPTLWEVFSNISEREDAKTLTNSQHIANVKLMADTLNFIEKYDIETLDDMTAAVQNLRNRYNKIKVEMSSVTRRFVTLQEHLNRAEIYSTNRAVYQKWYSLKGDKADDYYSKHSDEIRDWLEAHKYFGRVLGEHKQIPLSDWKREFADVSAKRTALYGEQDNISNEIKSAETIKRNAEVVMGVGRRQRGVEMDR
jgi:hypothetical protein